MINTLLHNNSMTKYRLSKLSGIPYTTINDICSGKADIKKSENKRVGFKVRTSVATASVRGTSGEIYSDGTLICLSGKWAITPPEPKGSKLHRTENTSKNSINDSGSQIS